MDIKCKACGEPWAIDSLHDLVAEGAAVDFDDARGMFYRDGCHAFGQGCTSVRYGGGSAIGVLQELLGDDVDGLAAMIEDFGL